MGLYPIVDNSAWVEKLALLGVKTIQLRIKSHEDDLQHEIKMSIQIAKKHQLTLFINDHWEFAIRYGASGIHLGQEDLNHADIDALRKANLYLGVSAYQPIEIARACALNPSYIAIGPIYSTTSKDLAVAPHGIGRLSDWIKEIPFPVVAIGGMTLDRIPQVLGTGVHGIALISAITKAAEPDNATRALLRLFDE